MTFLVDPPINDSEAKDVLATAYADVFKDFVSDEYVFQNGYPNLFALGIAQAIGFMEGGPYGKWGHGGKGPGSSGIMGEAAAGGNLPSNNWGALTRAPNSDGSCPADSFLHRDSKFDEESGSVKEYTTCFRRYDTSLEGAKDFLRRLYVDRPATFEAALAGDIRGVAENLYATQYYLGTAPPSSTDEDGNFVNVNNYVAFIGRGVDQIADLYPHGEEESGASEKSNVGLILGITGAALVGLVVAVNR